MLQKRGISSRLWVTAMLVLTAAAFRSEAQYYNGSQISFGRSKVQYTDFQWTFFQYERFDTYFYLNGKELAVFTAEYARDQIRETEKRLETSLDDKIQFMIFNTLTDLKQSNLGLLSEEGTYNTGGITQILDQKVILHFNGDHDHFKRQIRRGITMVILNQMLYGSSITSQVKNNTLLFLPDWYLNGLVSYLTEDWNTETDNLVRDGIMTGRYRKFNQLTGPDAAYAGHSIWRFVAEKYGPTVVSNIIYMAKISKNVESGFMFVLGVSFRTITREWIHFYQGKYGRAPGPDSLPEPAAVLLHSKAGQVFQRARVSPDGNYIAYTTNSSGQYKVFLRNTATGKTKRILRRGYRLDGETDYSYPLLAWHPSGKLLSIILEEKGRTSLYFYSLATGRFDQRYLFQFDKVVDHAYAPDAKSLVMSAVMKGFTDIFVYNIAANTFDQITGDVYDDFSPRFIENGKKIIFTSNRSGDSLRPAVPPGLYAPMQPRHDLFVYDYAGRKPLLKRITDSPLADERYPMEYAPGYISYLSDENGVFNRYVARFDSAVAFVDTTTHYRYFTVTYPVTDYGRNILEQDISPASGTFAEILFYGNRYHLFSGAAVPAAQSSPRSLSQTAYMNQLQKEIKKQETDSAAQLKKQYQARKKRFLSVRANEVDERHDSLPVRDKIDINNYVFEKQAFIKLQTRDSLAASTPDIQPAEKKDLALVVPKQQNYYVEYSINQLVSQVDFMYLNYTYQPFTGGTQPIYMNPGFNALLKVGVADLMENYRITGGVRLSMNLANNEYLLSYANLKNRLDREITFHRQIIENTEELPYYSITRHYSHELYYLLNWPLDEVMSLRGTGSYRNDRAVYLSTDEQNLKEPDVYRNWAGIKGEFVYDDTRSLGLNLMYGTRFKLFGEYFYEMNDNRGLAVLGVDVRNYRKLHRTLIWANRFAASTSFGNDRLIYYMGGVDNWLAPRFNGDVPVATDKSYAYQALATNLRGFTQNIRNGNSFAVINSELRFPVFRYFANRPIKSDFINNFQLITFGDIGTAWNGPSPYARENSLYKRVITQGPITITIENQVEPIVGGYGLGFRTRFLGYFLRADYAWGIEDKEVNKGVFYLSLSLDF